MRKKAIFIFLSLFILCSGFFCLMACDVYSDAVERGKYKRSTADLISLSNAIHIYADENQKVPEVQSLEELEKILVPFYMRKFLGKDQWGNRFFYKKTGEKSFLVGCAGGDERFEGFDQEGTYSEHEIKGQDIIITYKKLVYGPEEYLKRRWFKTE